MLRNEHGQEVKILVKAPSVMENSRTEQRGELLRTVPAEVAQPDSRVYFSQGGLVMSPRTHRHQQSPHAKLLHLKVSS